MNVKIIPFFHNYELTTQLRHVVAEHSLIDDSFPREILSPDWRKLIEIEIEQNKTRCIPTETIISKLDKYEKLESTNEPL